MGDVRKEKDDTRGFVSLDSYVEPVVETRGLLKRMGEDLWAQLRPSKDERLELYDKLWRIQDEIRDMLAPPPACGPLVRDLHRTLEDWMAEEEPEGLSRLIVYPPGNRAEFVRLWAEESDAVVLDKETDGLEGACRHLSESGPEDLIVIPALQDWFRRKVGGLHDVRHLFVAMTEARCRIVVGCDSWAWQFLIKVMDAHHLLPEALVFQAFDAERLRRWLRTIVRRSHVDNDVPFRSAQTGADIFDASSGDDYFRSLAAKSLGIPWTAWAIWRDSLFTTNRTSLSDAIWVRPPELPSLPDDDERECLMILHTLLLHDGLKAHELSELLPVTHARTTLAMLQTTKFVMEEGGVYRVTRTAYPTAKVSLEDAGYPGDGI